MKECFQPHALMHSLIGLGLGLFLVNIFPSLNIMWLGPALIVVALVMDMMRK